jgi:hypothetical protein
MYINKRNVESLANVIRINQRRVGKKIIESKPKCGRKYPESVGWKME